MPKNHTLLQPRNLSKRKRRKWLAVKFIEIFWKKKSPKISKICKICKICKNLQNFQKFWTISGNLGIFGGQTQKFKRKNEFALRAKKVQKLSNFDNFLSFFWKKSSKKCFFTAAGAYCLRLHDGKTSIRHNHKIVKKKFFLPPYRGTGIFFKKDKNTGKKKPHLDFLSPIAPLSRRGGSVFLTVFPNKFPVLKTVSKNGPDSKMLYFFIDIRSRGAVDVIPFLAHFRKIDISRKSHFLSVKDPFFGIFRFWPREISRLQNSMKISDFSFFNVAQKQGCVLVSKFFREISRL